MQGEDQEEDLRLAIELQLQFNDEQAYRLSLQNWEKQLPQESSKPSPRVSHSSRREVSVVDPSWELTDPNPDVRSLFLEFNDTYFWGKLDCVEVRWSPRMTLCAGLCCYEGRGGLCSVRLSEPLLKLRPRKDLVETLLHEMIHAYLFVTHNNRDHDAHGPEFHKHMHRINKASGANITVFHSFHGEVASYRTHWWRCTGPCQQRKPFFGLVKRAMNRAPSERDPWWADHKRSCGGTFVKIKEPEAKGKRKENEKDRGEGKAAKKRKSDGADIRTMLIPPTIVRAGSADHAGAKPFQSLHNGNSSNKELHGSNVHTLSSSTKALKKSEGVPFSGPGYKLGGGVRRKSNGSYGLLTPDMARTVSAEHSKQSIASNLPKRPDESRVSKAATAAFGNSDVLGRSVDHLQHPMTPNSIKRFDELRVSDPSTSGAASATARQMRSEERRSFLSSARPKQMTLTELFEDAHGSTIQQNGSKLSRSASAAKMQFLSQLLSSDSSDAEGDDDTILVDLSATDTVIEDDGMAVPGTFSTAIVRQENVTGRSASGASTTIDCKLVECPVCGQFVESRLINTHLDTVCLVV